MGKIKTFATAFSILVLFASWGQARVEIEIEFCSLPSEQGWQYEAVGVGSGLEETDVFSVDCMALTSNTIGSPTSGPGSNLYEIYGIVDQCQPYTIEWRSRVLESEGSAGAGNFGFAIGSDTGVERLGVGMSTNRLDVFSNDEILSISLDNTIFRNYRVEVVPAQGWSVFVDESPVFQNLEFSPGFKNVIVLGDGTGLQNCHAEVVSYRFAQNNAILLGDTNLDGSIDLLDVSPFVDVLSAGSYQAEADIDCNGEVNLLDVAPFIDLLTGF